ncbi:MAG: CTP synthase [bacterium]|nr:CTP synthase [bacterium]
MKKNTKFIFVVGGVVSGIGKGTSVSSIALLLKARGFRVTAVKIDPYLNVDAGTMNPTEHGEVFVTIDGLECDQDLGNYERFLDTDLSRANYMTNGQVYLSVIEKERNLGYGGRCVEPVPHIPEEVIRRLEKAADINKAEFCIVEIGGTVGEYQSLMFLEAARIMQRKHPGDILVVLVSYFPVPPSIGEMKSKPTQAAIRMLNEAGLQPDIVIGRSERPIDDVRRRKVATNSNLDIEDVISAPDVKSIYDIPMNFENGGMTDRILAKAGLRSRRRDLKAWRQFVERGKTAQRVVKIGVVGKYFGIGDFTLSDSYISVIEAIKHASSAEHARHEITWVDAEKFEKDPKSVKELAAFDGILVPGGFGARGVEGKIQAIRFAREKKKPYFGLCYGMQLATIEFARHVLKLKGAHTTEVDVKSPHPVIDILPEQKKLMEKKEYGGTMRLGGYACSLEEKTLAHGAYKAFGKERMHGSVIQERHRHRFEFNNDYIKQFAKGGMVASGTNPDRNLVEIMELKGHPFFLGTQFHPEFQSRPLRPHPLFRAFVHACLRQA